MKNHTDTEENYLKCILKFSSDKEDEDLEKTLVSTNTIAHYLGTSAASVTDMLKKLGKKELILYTPYKGVTLTEKGKKIALRIVRKHRLWEVFLVEKLKFSWDNVHDVAEQLEHVDSEELIRRIDEFLEYPKFDPHGDPIPSESGEMATRDTHLLGDLDEGQHATIVGVKDSDPDFLQYLEQTDLTLHQNITLIDKFAFDNSLRLKVNGEKIVISGKVAENLLVLKGAAAKKD